MSYELLKKELKSGTLRNVYLFYGEEQYLKRYYFNQLVKKAIGEETDFNFVKLSGKTLDLDELSVNCESYPLMSEKKVVVVDDLKINGMPKEQLETITAIVQELPDYTLLIFYEETVETDDKKTDFTAFTTSFSKSGLVVNFQKATEGDLVAWVLRQVKSRNKTIDTPLALQLINFCDSDMTTLKNEIEKLCSYCVTETITKKQLDAVVTKTLDAQVFDLTDALLKSDYQLSFTVLKELLNQGVDPTMIAATIYSALIRLYKVKTAAAGGLSKAATAKLFSMKEYAVEMNLRQCKNVPTEFLRKTLLACEKTDRALKSTKTDKGIVIERLIGEILLLETKV